MSDDEDLQEIDFVFDDGIIDLPPSGAVKNPLGDSMDKMVDGTLFRCVYLEGRREYRVTSHTPVEDGHPLILNELIERGAAKRWAEHHFMEGLSPDTAALDLGISKLQAKIPGELRKRNEGQIVQSELEAIDGFGSF